VVGGDPGHLDPARAFLDKVERPVTLDRAGFDPPFEIEPARTNLSAPSRVIVDDATDHAVLESA
jgi:hypothetical protein